MDIEEFRSAGTLPTGPVSAWPQERHEKFIAAAAPRTHATKVNASVGKMASGLLRTAGQAIMHGKVSEEIRNERYETCKACPHFIVDSKRCSECGCFMEAKTWVNGPKERLCPKNKWSR